MTLLGNIQLKHIGNLTTPKTQGRAVVSSIQPATHPKRGRPPSPTTQKATEILNKHPKTSPKELRRMLHRKGITITANHARQLKHQFSNGNNQFSNALTKIRHNNISQLYQLYPQDIYDIILEYILHKEAQNRRFIKCLRAINYKPLYNSENRHNRYQDDLALQTIDHNYRERRCITQLKNKETFIERNHKHRHNNKTQNIAYHVGDHDLCKFLCNYLGVEYKSRIYIGKGHYISTDASGLDICCLECFKQLLDTSIKTQREGTWLLKSAFIHGKLLVGNMVKSQW